MQMVVNNLMAKARKLMNIDNLDRSIFISMHLDIGKLLYLRASNLMNKTPNFEEIMAVEALLKDAEGYLLSIIQVLQVSDAEIADVQEACFHISYNFGRLYLMQKNVKKAIIKLQGIFESVPFINQHKSRKICVIEESFSPFAETLIQAYTENNEVNKAAECLSNASKQFLKQSFSVAIGLQMDSWIGKYAFVMENTRTCQGSEIENTTENLVQGARHFLCAAAVRSEQHAISLLQVLFESRTDIKAPEMFGEDHQLKYKCYGTKIALLVLADENTAFAIMAAEQVRSATVSLLRAVAADLFQAIQSENCSSAKITECSSLLIAAFHFSCAKDRRQIARLVSASYLLQNDLVKAKEYIAISVRANAYQIAQSETSALECLVNFFISLASEDVQSSEKHLELLLSCPDYSTLSAKSAVQIASRFQNMLGVQTAKKVAMASETPYNIKTSRFEEGDVISILVTWFSSLLNYFGKYIEESNNPEQKVDIPQYMVSQSKPLIGEMLQENSQESKYQGFLTEISSIYKILKDRINDFEFKAFSREIVNNIRFLVENGVLACYKGFQTRNYQICLDTAYCIFPIIEKSRSLMQKNDSSDFVACSIDIIVSHIRLLLLSSQVVISAQHSNMPGNGSNPERLAKVSNWLSKAAYLTKKLPSNHTHKESFMHARGILKLYLALLQCKSRKYLNRVFSNLEKCFPSLTNQQLGQLFAAVSHPGMFPMCSIVLFCDILAEFMDDNPNKIDISIFIILVELFTIQNSAQVQIKGLEALLVSLTRICTPECRLNGHCTTVNHETPQLIYSGSKLEEAANFLASSAYYGGLLYKHKGSLALSGRFMSVAKQAAAIGGCTAISCLMRENTEKGKMSDGGLMSPNQSTKLGDELQEEEIITTTTLENPKMTMEKDGEPAIEQDLLSDKPLDEEGPKSYETITLEANSKDLDNDTSVTKKGTSFGAYDTIVTDRKRDQRTSAHPSCGQASTLLVNVAQHPRDLTYDSLSSDIDQKVECDVTATKQSQNRGTEPQPQHKVAESPICFVDAIGTSPKKQEDQSNREILKLDTKSGYPAARKSKKRKSNWLNRISIQCRKTGADKEWSLRKQPQTLKVSKHHCGQANKVPLHSCEPNGGTYDNYPTNDTADALSLDEIS